MIIQLKKFGSVLSSRQAGKEAFAAFAPYLHNLSSTEKIEIDFQDVLVFSPSWGDEFLTPLLTLYKDKVEMNNTNNLSVKATLELLESIKWNDLK